MSTDIMYQGLLDDCELDVANSNERGAPEIPSISPLKTLGSFYNLNSAAEQFSDSSMFYDDDNEFSDNYDDVTEETVAMKEQEVSALRDSIKDLQERFIWDLSLAMKRKICSEKGMTSSESIAVSAVSISSIVESFNEEKPSPKTWINWVTEKLSRSA